jgi:hypothetical protein
VIAENANFMMSGLYGPNNIARSFGEKELLVIRIDSKDGSSSSSSSTSASQDELIDNIFKDEINLVKQYKACSNDQFILKPAKGPTIKNGVATIQVKKSVVGRTTEDVYKEVESKALTQFNVKSIRDIADLIMICMPFGTLTGNSNNWRAYVPSKQPYVNYLSVYNDGWCTSLSAGMHETAHNIGLQHAGENNYGEYSDESGVMGFSSKDDNGPMKCFNTAKSWQLGWYAEQSKRINPLLDVPFITTMMGITTTRNVNNNDDNDDFNNKNIIIQIPNGQSDFYVGYNRQNLFNSGTQEGKDMVLVHEQQGGGFKNSNLLAKLDDTESYTIQNYQGTGKNLIIKMIERQSNNDEALINIYFENEKEEEESSVVAGGCTNKQVRFEVNVVTDKYPEDNSWTLVNDRTGDTVASRLRGNFLPFTSHNDLFCIDNMAEYTFTLYDVYKDGLCCNKGYGSYSGFLQGKEIFRGGEFKGINSISHKFIVERKNLPTAIPTLPPTNTCVDDPSLEYKTVKRCNWVGFNTETRCELSWQNKLLKQFCPVTCGLCQETMMIMDDNDNDNDNDNVAPTVTPTEPITKRSPPTTNSLPPPPPPETILDDASLSLCVDDSLFKYKGKKRCNWIGKRRKKRCNLILQDGKLVNEYCPLTCGVCAAANGGGAIYTISVSSDVDVCKDDMNFRFNGKGKKSCNKWVKKAAAKEQNKLKKRCNKVDPITKKSVESFCPSVCNDEC